jgi:hypothetical protein
LLQNWTCGVPVGLLRGLCTRSRLVVLLSVGSDCAQNACSTDPARARKAARRNSQSHVAAEPADLAHHRVRSDVTLARCLRRRRRLRRLTTASLDGLPLLPWMFCKQPRVRKRAATRTQRPCLRQQSERHCLRQRTERLAGNTQNASPATHLTPADHPKRHACAGAASVGSSLSACRRARIQAGPRPTGSGCSPPSGTRRSRPARGADRQRIHTAVRAAYATAARARGALPTGGKSPGQAPACRRPPLALLGPSPARCRRAAIRRCCCQRQTAHPGARTGARAGCSWLSRGDAPTGPSRAHASCSGRSLSAKRNEPRRCQVRINGWVPHRRTRAHARARSRHELAVPRHSIGSGFEIG